MDYLEAAAAAYLKSGLRSKSAELLLARHLAFTEAHALGLLIGYPAAKIGVVDVLKLGGSAVLGLIQLGAAISIGQSHGVGVGILALSLMVTASSLYRRNKIDAKIADAMRYEHLLKVCNVLNREAPSPAEVTSLMDAGASKLCVWPDGLRSIVEVALSRNRALWS